MYNYRRGPLLWGFFNSDMWNVAYDSGRIQYHKCRHFLEANHGFHVDQYQYPTFPGLIKARMGSWLGFWDSESGAGLILPSWVAKTAVQHGYSSYVYKVTKQALYLLALQKEPSILYIFQQPKVAAALASTIWLNEESIRKSPSSIRNTSTSTFHRVPIKP